MNDESIKLSKEIGESLSSSWKMCCKILSIICFIELLVISYCVYQICNTEVSVDFSDVSINESVSSKIINE